MKTSAQQKWKNLAYVAAILVVSFLMTVFSVACLAKDYYIFSYYELYLPMTVMVFIILITLYYYILKMDNESDEYISVLKRCLICYSTIFIAVIISAVLYSYFTPHSVIISSVTMMVTMLLNKKLGVFCTFVSMGVMMAIFVTSSYVLDIDNFNLDIIGCLLTSMIMSLCMVFLLGREYSRLRLTWGTILLGIITTPLSAVYSIFGHGVSLVTIASSFFGRLVGVMISVAIFILLLPLYETIFAVWTNFKLAEVCSPSQPLLKELREKAPGTYNHCVSVANLVESCADAIDLNPYMARACAYFHDVGKMRHPEYFTENQKDGRNPHDDLIPEVSVNMITAHVKDGVKILKEHHMPETIIKAAYEHHGDATVPYFYMKAQSITEDELSNYTYRYNARKPTTKYSALVMICDICEAIMRSKTPQDYEQMRAIVDNVITSKLNEGQFDDCTLTVKDFVIIKDTICDVIPSTLHKRIDYDKAKERR
ncbi:MAG: HDIG domain-containing protein [Clostridia bacterium]|nr:HDIG domain-containing protein [Clostridia bacterium]MDE7329329.1 HDIG domain-containing protein [Clostridia bacterium]